MLDKRFASAEHKANVEGDLKGAIEEYKRILAVAGNDRSAAARALLRMAEAYQKLGIAEAQAIYQRLVRDYPDQPAEVVVARARLATPATVARAKSDWSVWTGRDADGFGTISPDGRFLTYTDWANDASLALRDLTTGTNHRLTSGGSTQYSAISKDGRQVAYEWVERNPATNARHYELRVARLHQTAISEARRLFYNEDVTGAVPFDWSPDGRWITVSVRRRDGTGQIGLIGVGDGSLRVLKSIAWREPTKIFFSPDGRHIAYDLRVNDISNESHVFVMAVDGSRETEIVADSSRNVIMGWSPDGRDVLFASDRSGSFGLWAVPIEDGKAAGTATLLKTDIASSWSLGLTSAGTMYVWKYASPIYLQASPIDLTSGTLVSGPTTFQRFISSRGRPDWSADGRFLAYQSCNPLGGAPCSLWIRSVDTGQVREVKVKLGYFFFARWSPDGRELLTRGSDLRDRNTGLYRIDAQTGESTLIVAPYPGNSQPQWAADGKHVYYRRASSVIERDLASGAEREVVKIPSAQPGSIAVSPDDRLVAYSAGGPSGAEDVFVLPVSGQAEPRLVFQVKAPERLGQFDWTENGSALAMAKRNQTGGAELWIVPISGEKPRKLDVETDNWMIEDGFRFDRAGKQLAFVAAAGQAGLEIRALENFLPVRAAPGRNPNK
jgi:Tol biopolymer transport system component